MLREVYVNQEKVVLTREHLIGNGGESEVFDISHLIRGKALKLFKDADHPDYDGCSDDQEGARERIAVWQTKFGNFPSNLPERVADPDQRYQVTDASGKLVGYIMQLISNAKSLRRYGVPFRKENDVSNETIIEIFRDLHPTITSLHARDIVIGDFNDLGVLAQGTKTYVIDIGAVSFGKYQSRMLKFPFVDPTLCDPNAKHLEMVLPHTKYSDWYAYAVMLMQSLVVNPYDGLYVPRDPRKDITHTVRPLKRITVFHPFVGYPKRDVALPYSILPDKLRQYFYEVIVQDKREVFPLELLDIEWQLCESCKVEHARESCPLCC